MNVENLNKLIAHLEAQPPEAFNMSQWQTLPGMGREFQYPVRNPLKRLFARHTCGTACCIAGHANVIRGAKLWDGPDAEGAWLGLDWEQSEDLFQPDHVADATRYPIDRAIATLKRLRDTYIRTGEVVVDWGPEPGTEPEQSKALPHSLTRLLAEPAPSLGQEG